MAWSKESGSGDDLPLTGSSPDTARVRVDLAQTGFWEGREFRLGLDITEPYVIQFTSPVNFALQSQVLESHDGTATFQAYGATQGVAGGTFDQTINVLPNNSMIGTPAYTPQVVALGGGTFTPNSGEIARESVKVVSSFFTALRTTVGGTEVRERGLPPGTYYLVFTGTDASYRLVYEERP